MFAKLRASAFNSNFNDFEYEIVNIFCRYYSIILPKYTTLYFELNFHSMRKVRQDKAAQRGDMWAHGINSNDKQIHFQYFLFFYFPFVQHSFKSPFLFVFVAAFCCYCYCCYCYCCCCCWLVLLFSMRVKCENKKIKVKNTHYMYIKINLSLMIGSLHDSASFILELCSCFSFVINNIFVWIQVTPLFYIEHIWCPKNYSIFLTHWIFIFSSRFYNYCPLSWATYLCHTFTQKFIERI